MILLILDTSNTVLLEQKLDLFRGKICLPFSVKFNVIEIKFMVINHQMFCKNMLCLLIPIFSKPMDSKYYSNLILSSILKVHLQNF